MQYQLVLIVFNIVIGLAAYFFLRDRRQLFRVIIMPIVYAYFLAAFLPYLLAFVPVNWVIVFYTVAVLLGFLAKGIDSRVQPDMEAEGVDLTAWNEADKDYIETRSEREALLNTVRFSKAQSDNEQGFSPIFSESTTSLKNLSSSEFFETSRPVSESSLLGRIPVPGNATSLKRSTDMVSQTTGNDDNKQEAGCTHSGLNSQNTQDPIEKSPQPGTSSIGQDPQPEEEPAQKFACILSEPTSDRQEEEKPVPAEPATTPHATVSYLSEYKEEKAALASAAGGLNVKPVEKVLEKNLPPVKTPPVLHEVPVHPATEIELNKKAVEEIAQKFVYKISNGHHEEASPAKGQETFLAGESEIPVIAAPYTEIDQEQYVMDKIPEIYQEPIVAIEPEEIPPQNAAGISEAPAERHLELVEASRDQHPDENEPEEFVGVEPLSTNQQIPVRDAGEIVPDKESINDQQEAAEDDLMQLDLALVIDRAFQAKFSSDYRKAIRIFEVALNRTPSPKLAQMIADDIEAMRSKLA